MSCEFSEKRRFERVNLKLPVNGHCLGSDDDSHTFRGETQDVSFAGFCIKIDSVNGFKVGQGVKFSTRLYEGDFLIKAQGRVCWVRNLNHPGWPVNMGVMVTKMRHYKLWCERIEDKIHQPS